MKLGYISMGPVSKNEFVFTGSPQYRQKMRQLISVSLVSGQIITGHLFTGMRQRALDLLNDSSAFLPIEVDDHKIVLLSKQNIALVECEKEAMRNAPHVMLEIEENTVDSEEIKLAYEKISAQLNIKFLEKHNTHKAVIDFAKGLQEKINRAYTDMQAISKKVLQSKSDKVSEESTSKEVLTNVIKKQMIQYKEEAKSSKKKSSSAVKKRSFGNRG